MLRLKLGGCIYSTVAIAVQRQGAGRLKDFEGELGRLAGA